MSDELGKEMKKLAAMGVTINVTPAAGREEGFEDRPSGRIARAAKDAGIYYEKGDRMSSETEATSEIAGLQRRIGKINTSNGWRKDGTIQYLTNVQKQITMLALITTEVAEAIEEIRNGHFVGEMYYSTPTGSDMRKPEGVPSELADVVIRALDCADAWGIDLGAVIEEKLAYNQQRGYRHGGKTA